MNTETSTTAADTATDPTAEQLRHVGFRDEGETVLAFRHGYLEAKVSAFEFFRARLAYDDDAARLDAIFQAWRQKTDAYGRRRSAREFVAWLAKRLPNANITGLYGDGEPMCIATVNNDNVLATDAQFTYFESGDTCRDHWVILGAGDYYDATRMSVFRVSTYECTDVLDYHRATIGCAGTDGEQHLWDTEDGCNWRDANGELPREMRDLRKLPVVTYDEDGDVEVYIDDRDAERGDLTFPQNIAIEQRGWVKGAIVRTADGTLLCPCCASKLALWPYPAG